MASEGTPCNAWTLKPWEYCVGIEIIGGDRVSRIGQTIVIKTKRGLKEWLMRTRWLPRAESVFG